MKWCLPIFKSLQKCHRSIPALMLLFFFPFHLTHLYWSTSNPQLNFKSCPSRKDSAKWEYHTFFLFTESVFKNREKTEYLSFFSPLSSGILKLISHTGYTWDSVKGDNFSASSKHACPPPRWERHHYLFVGKLQTTQEYLLSKFEMSSGIKYHMTNTFPLRKKIARVPFACCLCYKRKREEDYNVFPNLAPGLHSSNFLGFWEVDIYFTSLLSWRNEFFFPRPFLTSEVFFPPTEIITVFPGHRCFFFSPPNIGNAETFMVKRKQRGKPESKGLWSVSFIFPSLLAMLISAPADTVKFYTRHKLAQILYLKKKSSQTWVEYLIICLRTLLDAWESPKQVKSNSKRPR